MSSKYYTARGARTTLLLAMFVAALAASLSANAEPAMWVIRDKDSTIYLIGTVHLLRHETEWASPKLDRALAESSELWLEVPNADDQQLAAQLIQRYGIDSKKPLSQKLNFIEKEKLAKLAADYHIPARNLETLQPWTVAMIFAVLPIQKAGYDPNAGVDRILQNKAKEKGEKIEGFETPEEQVRFLADLPEKEQIAFLDDTFEDVAEGIEKLDKIAVAWVNGDTRDDRQSVGERNEEGISDVVRKIDRGTQCSLVRKNREDASTFRSAIDRSRRRSPHRRGQCAKPTGEARNHRRAILALSRSRFFRITQPIIQPARQQPAHTEHVDRGANGAIAQAIFALAKFARPMVDRNLHQLISRAFHQRRNKPMHALERQPARRRIRAASLSKCSRYRARRPS